jgi:hypothetical protein
MSTAPGDMSSARRKRPTAESGVRAFAAVAAVLTSIGCGASASLDHIKSIDRLPLRSEIVFDRRGERNGPRIFEIAASADGEELRIVMARGVVWATTSGAAVRSIDFVAKPGALAPVRSLREGDATHYAGFDFGGRRLLFFDNDGQHVATQPCRDCWDLVVADVDGAGRDSLIVRAIDGKSAAMFTARGTARTTYPTRGFLTDIGAGRVGDELASSLFFYVAPDPDLGRAVRVVRGDGSERARWGTANVRGIVASTSADGTASILSIDSNTLVEQDALSGKTLSRTTVEGSSAFRSFFAGRWRDGSRVVLFSGGGYLSKHMVAVIDASGSVVFQEVGDGRSYGLSISSPRASMFYIAIDGYVKKYSIP